MRCSVPASNLCRATHLSPCRGAEEGFAPSVDHNFAADQPAVPAAMLLADHALLGAGPVQTRQADQLHYSGRSRVRLHCFPCRGRWIVWQKLRAGNEQCMICWQQRCVNGAKPSSGTSTTLSACATSSTICKSAAAKSASCTTDSCTTAAHWAVGSSSAAAATCASTTRFPFQRERGKPDSCHYTPYSFPSFLQQPSHRAFAGIATRPILNYVLRWCQKSTRKKWVTLNPIHALANSFHQSLPHLASAFCEPSKHILEY